MNLDLFTRVEDLKQEGRYPLAIHVSGFTFQPDGKVWFDEESNKWYDKEGKQITHVLDLSKLTTKEKAITMALKAHKHSTGYAPIPTEFIKAVENLKKDL